MQTPRRDAAATARRLMVARSAGATLSPLSADGPLPLAEAYEIQRELTSLRYARGEARVGWKLGYTSLAMRVQMGVDAPNYGPLTDAMLLPSGGVVPPSALQPRVEPEIGLRFARRMSGVVSVDDVLAACDGAYACLEVVDSVWTDYRFTLEDNTADGSSAAWVVVGPSIPMDDLAAVSVDLVGNGEVMASATGTAASGHPAEGVVWLAAQLGLDGNVLEAGDIVITGGLTASYPLEVGDVISGTFRAEGHEVTLTVTR